jgi:hypothetical protein
MFGDRREKIAAAASAKKGDLGLRSVSSFGLVE